jgi:hypothetical protein
VRIGCDFSSAKVADRGVAGRRVVDERVADGCVVDGHVFCKQDTLLLNFKITPNIFGFKLNSTNKSCRARFQKYNKISLAIFGFFYKFLSILQVDSFCKQY